MKSVLIFLVFVPFLSFSQVNDKICSKIEMRVDSFKNDTTYYSPYKAGYLDVIHFAKSKGRIFMTLKAAGSTLNLNKKGVIILLSDGTKIEKPEQDVSVDVNTTTIGIYDYSAFVSLDESDIEKLSNSTVKGFQLYIYDGWVQPKKALTYQEYLKCMSKK